MGCVIQKVFCCESIEPRKKNKFSKISEQENNKNKEMLPIEDMTSITDPNHQDNPVTKIDDIKIKTSSCVLKRTGMPSDHYEKLAILGEGSFGVVCKVLHKATGQIRAMKIIQKKTLSIGVTEEEIEAEINILKKLDHMNIIKIFEVFDDDCNFYIVTEFCSEGSLYDKLIQMSKFNENIVKLIMFEVLSAVSYLHSQKIIHGDLKLENIMIDKIAMKHRSSFRTSVVNDLKELSNIKGYNNINERLKNSQNFSVKLIDFGCSKIFNHKIKDDEVIGTLNYCAPEVLLNDYNEKSDLWSCGVIMYILLSGKWPFEGKDEEEITKNILEGNVNFDDKHFDSVSINAINLIKSLLIYDPNLRPSASEALTHPFFKERIESSRNFIENNINDSKSILMKLKNYHVKSKFSEAVLSFITHNFAKKDEILNLRKTFQIIDKNNDGIISKKELLQGYEEIGVPISEAELDHLMRTMDSDNSGNIEYEEFLRATIDKKNLFNDVNLKLAFDSFDRDHNGKISLQEIESMIDITLPENVTHELLAEINKKDDEEITYESFKNLTLQESI